MPSSTVERPGPRSGRAVALLAAALLASSCFDPIPPDTLTSPANGGVSGRVRDLCSARGLAGVLVTPRPIEDGTPGAPIAGVTTDDQGRYALDDLERGDWQLLLSKAGYQSIEQPITIRPGQIEQLDASVPPTQTDRPAKAKLDVLFVIDNSNSMAEEQKALVQAFPRFLDALLLSGVQLDLRIGVTTTDIGAGPYTVPACALNGDGGKLQSKPRIAGCQPPRDAYLSLVGNTTNVSGDLVNEAFSCIALVGTEGCGFEQPLGVALRALDGKTNPGFPRPDAALAVVVLSDEDDCTAVDPTLFDPNSTAGPLGPLLSFRCFAQGILCNGKAPGAPGSYDGCAPRPEGYLLTIDRFIEKLTAGRSTERLFFAAIAGPTAETIQVGTVEDGLVLLPTCQTTATRADPAIRLRAVAERLAPHGAFQSICSAELGSVLAGLARQIVETTVLSPCAASDGA